MANAKPLLNTPRAFVPDTTLHVDGHTVAAQTGESLIEALNRAADMRGEKIPQVCYLPAMAVPLLMQPLARRSKEPVDETGVQTH
jgi:hypothetical protein